jgi:hypothetical protein
MLGWLMGRMHSGENGSCGDAGSRPGRGGWVTRRKRPASGLRGRERTKWKQAGFGFAWEIGELAGLGWFGGKRENGPGPVRR